MRRVSVKNDPGDSHMCQNQKGPHSDEYRRLERRWKRWELSNDRLKRNCFGDATSLTVNKCGNGDATSLTLNKCGNGGAKSLTVNKCGNGTILTGKCGHISEDEIDEDYQMYLDTYVSDNDIVGDDIVNSSKIGINTGYNSDNDYSDPQYKMYLEKLREEGDSYYQVAGEEEERLHNKLKPVTVKLKGSKQSDKTINLRNKRSNSMRKQTGGPMEYQHKLETKRELFRKKRPHQDVSSVPKSNYHSNVEFDDVDEDYQLFLNSCRIEDDHLVYMGSGLMGNSQVSDHAFDTPDALSEIDEDYQLFLNSVKIVDGDVLYMPERKTSKTDNEEGGSNSSDSDLILLEPDQIYGNTAFVSSKTYDSSWFEYERTPRDSHEHSQFRRRLMDDLQRPYDQEECDRLLHEVNQNRQRERHVETRRGVVKSYHSKGVNKSYLQLYPDLAKAMAEVEKPERILFLLRGFFFWLQNLSHDIFKPWLDKSYLEILQKM